jgi:hypothetical protein
MPTGPPDPASRPERPPKPAGHARKGDLTARDAFETSVDRIIREAMKAGDFDDLPGTGQPIPGAGTIDDDVWWVRSWIRRNRESDGQNPSKRE